MDNNERMVMGVAWYKPEQWDRLLEVSEDRDDMQKTFAAWEETAKKTIDDIAMKGTRIEKIILDVDELVLWCRKRNKPVNAETRSEFTSEKMRQQAGGE